MSVAWRGTWTKGRCAWQGETPGQDAHHIHAEFNGEEAETIGRRRRRMREGQTTWNEESCFSKSKRKSQDNRQKLTGATIMLSWHGCHVNVRVQNNVQRKLRRRSRKASGVSLFHSIKALYQKLLIMRQAAQTDYVHTRLIKVTCTRTPRVLPWGGYWHKVHSLIYIQYAASHAASVPPW